jgi:hypothetical protein
LQGSNSNTKTESISNLDRESSPNTMPIVKMYPGLNPLFVFVCLTTFWTIWIIQF